jgi:hypothetical protein
MTIGFLKATETISQILAKNLKELLDSYGLSKKIIAYVKDEGTNLNFMTTTLKSIVNCEVLSLEESFNGTCLVVHFPKLFNMLLLKKRFAKILSMFQSNLCNLISRNVECDPKNLEREDKSEQKLVLSLKFDQGN